MLKKFRKDKKLKKEVSTEADLPAANEPMPRITNDTVAEHREEVLSSARKYIYPLQHSKHRIVLWSVTIFIVTILAFFTYCTVALYKLQSTSAFVYVVTRVVPFPVARTGKTLIAYENYLFELRHYMHYYEVQQKLDFNSESGQQQLGEFKKKALKQVIDDAYIKQIAKEQGIKVSDQEVNDQITVLRQQNRLGSNDKVFEDVLRDYWGWTVADYKRSLRQQMLTQKVVASLDTATQEKAKNALAELKATNDFPAVAKKYSDDIANKDSGGEYGFLIDKTNRDLTPQTTDMLFKLQPGQYSDIINTGYSLEIVKALEKKEDKVRGAHILFNFKSIDSYLNDRKDKQKTRVYIPVDPNPSAQPQ
jgi:parvulin-like peptidyl-prolyl isomerase